MGSICCIKLEIRKKKKLSQIIKKRKELNLNQNILPTPGKNGHQVDLINIIKEDLLKNLPNNLEIPTIWKISVDGAQIFRKKRTKQIIVTVQRIDNKPLSIIKSPKDAHQISVYIGEENRSNFDNELSDIQNQVNNLIKNKFIKINDIEYPVKLYLVCDLACLVDFIGLNSVYHPNATFKCPWCRVSYSEINDFEKVRWPFRSLQQQKEWGNLNSNMTNNTASKLYGTIVSIKD